MTEDKSTTSSENPELEATNILDPDINAQDLHLTEDDIDLELEDILMDSTSDQEAGLDEDIDFDLDLDMEVSPADQEDIDFELDPELLDTAEPKAEEEVDFDLEDPVIEADEATPGPEAQHEALDLTEPSVPDDTGLEPGAAPETDDSDIDLDLLDLTAEESETRVVEEEAGDLIMKDMIDLDDLEDRPEEALDGIELDEDIESSQYFEPEEIIEAIPQPAPTTPLGEGPEQDVDIDTLASPPWAREESVPPESWPEAQVNEELDEDVQPAADAPPAPAPLMDMALLEAAVERTIQGTLGHIPDQLDNTMANAFRESVEDLFGRLETTVGKSVQDALSPIPNRLEDTIEKSVQDHFSSVPNHIENVLGNSFQALAGPYRTAWQQWSKSPFWNPPHL